VGVRRERAALRDHASLAATDAVSDEV